MGDHPVAWSHEYSGGRAWYTAGGHTRESYTEPLFVAHLLGGIQYAASLGVVGAQRGERLRNDRMPSAMPAAASDGFPSSSWRSSALVRKPVSTIACGTPGATAWQ